MTRQFLLLAGLLTMMISPGASGAEELRVGSVAPAFELLGSDGKTHKLSDFAGKQVVVIAWYPKAFTGG